MPKHVVVQADLLPQGVELVELPTHVDERGELVVAENSNLPFEPRRVFWITHVPTTAERGGHAHRTCAEVLYALAGKVKIDLSDGNRETTIELSQANTGVIIPRWFGVDSMTSLLISLDFALRRNPTKPKVTYANGMFSSKNCILLNIKSDAYFRSSVQ